MARPTKGGPPWGTVLQNGIAPPSTSPPRRSSSFFGRGGRLARPLRSLGMLSALQPRPGGRHGSTERTTPIVQSSSKTAGNLSRQHGRRDARRHQRNSGHQAIGRGQRPSPSRHGRALFGRGGRLARPSSPHSPTAIVCHPAHRPRSRTRHQRARRPPPPKREDSPGRRRFLAVGRGFPGCSGKPWRLFRASAPSCRSGACKHTRCGLKSALHG